MSSYTPVPSPLPIPPVSAITPFTYRDLITFLDILYALARYTAAMSGEVDAKIAQLIEDVNAALQAQADATNLALSELTIYVDSEIADMRAYVDAAVASIIDANVEITDPIIAGAIDDEDSDSRAIVDHLIALSGKPPQLTGATLTAGYTGTIPIEYIDGVMYGTLDAAIRKSVDNGATWTTIATAPGTLIRMIPTSDGEMVVTNGANVWKTNGWAANPATATYDLKLTKSVPTGVGIVRWGFDGDGTKFIVTEYSGTDRSESRYVWISVNSGTTFSIVLDKTLIDPGNTSHMHAVCYDPWEDRFWLTHGHGTIRGTYYSNNNGTTWTMIGGAFQPDAAPTLLIATDDGIVAGSDSADSGLYGIARAPLGRLELRRTARWVTPREGVTGFSSGGYRDPATGMVYVGFKSDFADVSTMIAAGGARAASVVWEDAAPAVSKTITPFVLNDGYLIADIDRTGSRDMLKAFTLDPAAIGFDNGNTSGGVAGTATAVAMGPGAVAGYVGSVAIGSKAKITGTAGTGVAVGGNAQGHPRGVAIGFGSTDSDTFTDAVAIGYNAKSDGSYGVAVGSAAIVLASSTGAVAIGSNSKAGPAGVAIGQAALGGPDISTSRGVAVGASASSGTDSIAIGHAAVASTGSVALGKSATATVGSGAVALGISVTATAVNQVAIGGKHIEMKEVTGVAAPAADTARLYIEDNGSGKTRLVIRFPTGAAIVLATEA